MLSPLMIAYPTTVLQMAAKCTQMVVHACKAVALKTTPFAEQNGLSVCSGGSSVKGATGDRSPQAHKGA